MTALQETMELLKKYNIKPRYKLGQNFLIDEGAVSREVDYASLNKEGIVLEVGAGIGYLTKHLLDKAGRVVVIEKDPRMVRILKDRFRGAGNMDIINADVLKIPLPRFDKVVSNIPYVISSPLTFKLLKESFKLGILTYQKEFAERMVANPGTKNYSRISVATFYHARAEILELLPPEAFYPRPKVSSAIVKIEPKKPPFRVNKEFFFKLLKGLFVHKKKTLKKALFHSHTMIFGDWTNKKEMENIAKKLSQGLLKKRVFQLSPEEIAGISDLLEEEHDRI